MSVGRRTTGWNEAATARAEYRGGAGASTIDSASVNKNSRMNSAIAMPKRRPDSGAYTARQRGRRLGRLAAAVARQHVLRVQAERARVGAQEAAHEHVGRQLRVIVVLELLQDAHRDARASARVPQSKPAAAPFPV